MLSSLFYALDALTTSEYVARLQRYLVFDTSTIYMVECIRQRHSRGHRSIGADETYHLQHAPDGHGYIRVLMCGAKHSQR